MTEISPDAQCYCSADADSSAPGRRGGAPTTNPVNQFLVSLREEWFDMTNEQKGDRLRRELLFIADPVSHLDDFDHSTLADYTLGELYHARLVILRLLRHIEAANAV